MSYDDVATLRAFASRESITFPLLSDPESKILASFGVVNPDNSPANRPEYAKPDMAFPGYFWIARDGSIRDRLLDADYDARTSAGSFLARICPRRPAPPGGAPSPERGLDLALSASDASVGPGSVLALRATIALPSGSHLVAADAPEPYQPLALAVEPTEGLIVDSIAYSPGHRLPLEDVKEDLPVLEGSFEIRVDARISTDPAFVRSLGRDRSIYHALVVHGTLRYQACDEHRCFPPAAIPVSWTVGVRQLEWKRLGQS